MSALPSKYKCLTNESPFLVISPRNIMVALPSSNKIRCIKIYFLKKKVSLHINLKTPNILLTDANHEFKRHLRLRKTEYGKHWKQIINTNVIWGINKSFNRFFTYFTVFNNITVALVDAALWIKIKWQYPFHFVLSLSRIVTFLHNSW